ncbi:hypothetical protein [Streptomyces sp. H27-D2]|uniref:hypothetical protein n=1 Tax=Streptomyces sp. H27-D2 TaxID=3046304 RepID=UPI002DB8FD5A|nr:hypothetical protein [Streptomyces sp. H27-D2]MEC4017470.1 hypothetical protein [Streptomyces sp. H27-D2]
MRRHEFEPAHLVAGTVLLGLGLAYALDAGGVLNVPAHALLWAAPVGLGLAGLTAVLSYAGRRRGVRRVERGG